jgi:hypothetical protein
LKRPDSNIRVIWVVPADYFVLERFSVAILRTEWSQEVGSFVAGSLLRLFAKAGNAVGLIACLPSSLKLRSVRKDRL